MGDSAYTLSPHVMTPFTKRDLQHPDTMDERDNYNFYLSQLRIRIEMSIGILVNKWRVFKTPIHFGINKCHKIIHSEICLHNYVINQKMVERNGNFNPEHEIRDVIKTYNNGKDDSYEHDDNDIHILPNQRTDAINKRQILVEHIKLHNMRRPRT